MSFAFDIDAYLARITLKHRPLPDADGLALIQSSHRLSIPFENLDIRLGRTISLDPAHVFDKIVHRRRGGYCFEQNSLFLGALQALGFEARPLLGRVWLMSDGGVPPRTHTLNLVRIDGEDWIADAGFGGSYIPPMKLADSVEAWAPDGASYRLSRSEDHGWMLERRGDAATSDWQPQYSFTLDQVAPIDLEMSNHWTSTRPDTRFTTLTIVNLCLPTGFAALTDRQYKRRAGGQQVEAEIESAKAYRLRLNFVFGIALDEVEVNGLGLY
ncbi:MAG: arylamine N-acetyltransferase [Pseudomonadota bacterium]